MNKVAILLDIQKQVRNARNLRDLGYIIANKTAALTPIKNTIFWTYRDGRVTIKAISGQASFEQDSPYAQTIKQKILQSLNTLSPNQLTQLKKKKAKESLKDEEEFGADHQYILPFMVDEKAVYIDTPKENDQQKHHLIGGLWLEDSNELNEADAELLKEVAASYGLCFAHLKLSAQKTSYFSGGKARKYKFIATIIAIIAFCFPVQLKITAPAEVISDKPFIISAPFDGLLDNVYVEPGQTIKKGDRLASMDKTELEARFETVEQELKIAQAAYAKTGLEALRNSERKADLRGLQADINARKTALKHAEIFLERSDIIAERDGIAIFSDQSTLINRPFRAGEKIMTIADQESAALLVRVPAQALLPVKEGTEFSFHLNPEPLTNRSARLNVIGYEPSQDSDGLLTYKLRAEIDEDDRDAVRIGWQGTANVPSKRSILGYAVLRRPLIALRDMIGL